MSTPITPIPTTRDRLFAFEINGEVSENDMSRMAEHMNDAFNQFDKVDMLLIFRPFDGAERGASLNREVIKSRFRALTNVDRYVVVGAPDCVDSLLKVMNTVIPVDARTYELENINRAWAHLDAWPTVNGVRPS